MQLGAGKEATRTCTQKDEDDSETVEESAEDEDDLQAWCPLEESENEQWQEVISRRNKQRVKRANQASLLSVESSQSLSPKKIVEVGDKWVKVTVTMGRKKGVERTKSKKAVKLAAASGSPIRVEGDARLEFIRDGMKCSMKFLDAHVKRPLASVSAVVEEGNVIVFGQHESFIETVSKDQRIPMCRRNGVFVMQLDTQPCQKTTKSVIFNEEGVMKRMSGFTRLA